jgi:hypothetical protein
MAQTISHAFEYTVVSCNGTGPQYPETFHGLMPLKTLFFLSKEQLSLFPTCTRAYIMQKHATAKYKKSWLGFQSSSL